MIRLGRITLYTNNPTLSAAWTRERGELNLAAASLPRPQVLDGPCASRAAGTESALRIPPTATSAGRSPRLADRGTESWPRTPPMAAPALGSVLASRAD